MKISSVPVGRINPAAYNPRIDLAPGDPEYHKLERSLDEFGCVEPLVWNRRTRNLVGGHQRFKILLARGVKEVEVSVVDLPLEKEKALNIALNKISGDWDHQKLARLLDELTRVPGLDLELTGFDLPDISALVADALLVDGGADRPEQFDVEAALAAGGPEVTKPGDLILLGRDRRLQHRLLCGDCTDPSQVRRLMDGKRAALFATDPPYLVGYNGSNHPGARHTWAKPGAKRKGSCGTSQVMWDDPDANPELYEKFLMVAVAEAIRPDAAWYTWHASRRQAELESAWSKAGAFVHCQIVWAKNRPILSRAWFAWKHEPCFFGWLRGKKPPKRSQQLLSTVWNVDTLPSGPQRPDHPTPKPLELFQIPMAQHTRAGEVCYEPFAGSGTQVIAAQRMGRRCFAAELSPRYCDVIVRRFIAYAGEDAVTPAIAKRYAPLPPPRPAGSTTLTTTSIASPSSIAGSAGRSHSAARPLEARNKPRAHRKASATTGARA